MANSFFPTSDDSLASWATDYRDTIESHATELSMTPAEVNEEKLLCDAIIDSLKDVSTERGKLKSALDHRDAVIADKGSKLRDRISHHKTAPGYTTAIGESLKIIAHNPIVNFDTYKASIKVELFAGHVRIKFAKKGVEGINLFNRKKGTSDWKFVRRLTISPFDHIFPLTVSGQPEHWEYRAFGVVMDQEVGIASDIVEIIYGG